MEKVGANALITVNYGMNSLGTGAGRAEGSGGVGRLRERQHVQHRQHRRRQQGHRLEDRRLLGEPARGRAAADRRRLQHVPHQPPGAVRHQVLGDRQRALRQRLLLRQLRLGSGHARPLPGDGDTCTDRKNNAALSPATYGTAVKAYATAMKAVDSTIKIGGIVVAHSDTEYTRLERMVLPRRAAPTHGLRVGALVRGRTRSPAARSTVPETEIPRAVHARAHRARDGVVQLPGRRQHADRDHRVGSEHQHGSGVTIPTSTADHAPAGSQIAGLFAAESYAKFMDQGALAAHWLELHNNSYLAGIDATNDPFTTAQRHARAGATTARRSRTSSPTGGDKMVQATQSGTVRHGAEGARVRARERRHRAS